MCACVHACMYLWMTVCIIELFYICTRTYRHITMCLYIYIYICMYVCIYIYIHTYRERERERERERVREREREGERDTYLLRKFYTSLYVYAHSLVYHQLER